MLISGNLRNLTSPTDVGHKLGFLETMLRVIHWTSVSIEQF